MGAGEVVDDFKLHHSTKSRCGTDLNHLCVTIASLQRPINSLSYFPACSQSDSSLGRQSALHNDGLSRLSQHAPFFKQIHSTHFWIIAKLD